ncbi:MAG: SigB/SigF/SigG family RNA polymerase sigma factor [Clostridia bacterium]|nr:SigB/SigF/SigG family RNA polymerase sigma factor [Clostridia bacterium]
MKWDPAQTRALIARSQEGDKAAREALAEENEPLVKSIVRRFSGRGAEKDDLLQLGRVGLLKAIAHFDLSQNVRFSTYAVPMICGEIKRFLRDDGPVKMPRSLKEKQRAFARAQQTLCASLGREAGIAEIADYMQISLEEAVTVLESMSPCDSLDRPVFEDGTASAVDFLEDPARRASVADRLALRQCLAQLEDRERKVILLRYVKHFTQARIAGILGLSQVQISRIESRTLEKLRRKMG